MSVVETTVAFEEVKSSTERPPKYIAFLLHGLLGSRADFRAFSHSLTSSLSSSSPPSDWRMVLVDLRNHGSSADREGLHPPHDMFNAARDLATLVKSQNWTWPDVVIGHSMGGRVALQYALSCACGDYGDSAQLPKQLWILDSVPGKVVNEKIYEEVEKALQTLQILPSPIPSKEWLVDHMIKLGVQKSLSEWIGNSLKKSGEHETWSFNLDGAAQMFKSSREMDYWPLVENTPNELEINIVRRESRTMWDPDVVKRLERLATQRGDGSESKVSVHVVSRAGHWIHEDDPEKLLGIMTPKIASLVYTNSTGLSN